MPQLAGISFITANLLLMTSRSAPLPAIVNIGYALKLRGSLWEKPAGRTGAWDNRDLEKMAGAVREKGG